jgi:hypothetical protein
MVEDRELVLPVSAAIVAAMEPMEATARPDASNSIASEHSSMAGLRSAQELHCFCYCWLARESSFVGLLLESVRQLAGQAAEVANAALSFLIGCQTPE